MIFGDDIGYWDFKLLQRRNDGLWHTDVDRLGRQRGTLFTDYYGQQSWPRRARGVHHRAKSCCRTGLTKVGMPGANLGLQPEDPTIAELLKPLGYATGQFGKNHLGDRDEFLPTNHGFDEFFGNLYHMNAEETGKPRLSERSGIQKTLGPRGVIHSWANPDGTQHIQDTGPLNSKRMETVDDEFLTAAVDFFAVPGRRASRSSCGSTPRACTCGRM